MLGCLCVSGRVMTSATNKGAGPFALWRCLWVCLGLFWATMPNTGAEAQTDARHDKGAQSKNTASLPARLPGGYVMEAQGRVRWMYPEAAQDEIAQLQQELPAAHKTLERALGISVASAWDIRVARQADEMAALAPGHHVPDYAIGVAYPEEGLILLSLAAPFTFDRPDLSRLLVHELAHVALHHAVRGQPLPRWFNEGVAIHLAGERSITRLRVLWEAAVRGKLQPLETLSRTFPGTHHDVNVSYAQSADLVEHMLSGVDEESRFKQLLGSIRQGQSFEQAVHTAYGVSMGYIEREWRNSLLRRFGRWPSVLSGLTFLWALTAVLLLVGYIRARRRHHRTLARWSIEEAQEAQLLEEAQLLQETSALQENQGSQNASVQIAVSDGQAARSQRLDDFLDRFNQRTKADAEIPTVEHDGQSHTLH